MRGFGSFEAAARFCAAHDELRDYFRSRQRMGETVPRATRRPLLRDRWAALMTLLAA
jgi:putative transposase